MGKIGLVLVNIGSPAAPDEKSVGIYLKKFLMDKKVIPLPFLLRWILVNGLIVPRRAKVSAKNYQKIWMKEENISPLIFYSRKFAEALQQNLGSEYIVRMAMAHSAPELESVIGELTQIGLSELVVAPMFPQFAEATTGSVRKSVQAPARFLPPFYKEFAEAQALVAQKSLYGRSFDHYLFSFHGLPEKQIREDQQCRLNEACCIQGSGCARNCYRAQCFETAELIAQKLKWTREKYSVSFQSRLGRSQWMQPYTSEVLSQFPARGIKKVAVFCPSFVVDGLETLEEIGLNGKQLFLECGGTDFHLVPCPNFSPEWVQIFADFVATAK